MKSERIRIFSDLHYGDRASALKSLASLRPLFEGADKIVLNGDTLDTRPGPMPDFTRALRQEVVEFFNVTHPSATLLTGNHDPDITHLHALEFAERRVLVTHGDILFENLVPWGRDAKELTRRVEEELSRLPLEERDRFESRMLAFRRAALSIPQRHQSEQNGLKYLMGFLTDTVWPPLRVLRVIEAWREAPRRAEMLVARQGFSAKFFVMGHTHRLGATRTPSGLVVINTGSFCPPCAGGVVDISEDGVALRAVQQRGGEYRLGPTLAAFSLAGE